MAMCEKHLKKNNFGVLLDPNLLFTCLQNIATTISNNDTDKNDTDDCGIDNNDNKKTLTILIV